MKKVPVITMSEWQTALDDLASENLKPVPSGWLTIPQVSIQMQLGESRAHKKIIALMKSGRAESRKFTVRTDGDGTIRAITHYRLKK